MTDVNAHPGGELTNLIGQQRQDTVDWQKANNLSPQGDSPVVGEVHVSDINEEISELGAQVSLSSSSHRVTGSVLASTDDEFWVDWEDGNQSIEKKANYKLISGIEATAPNSMGAPCSCGKPGCNGMHGDINSNPSTGTTPYGQVGPAGGIKY